MESDEGMRTEGMVSGCIFLSCDCVDIGVPGGIDGSGVWTGVGRCMAAWTSRWGCE